MVSGSGADLLGVSDTSEFWFLMAVLAALALFLLREAARRFWQLRTMADTPTAKIQSAPQGYVELAGLVADGRGVVAAPLTGVPCVWFRYRVEEKQGRGRNQDWRTLDKGMSEGAFLLDDGTGRCLVDPRGAQIKPHRTDRWMGPHRNAPRRKGQLVWLDTGERYRFTEERIQVGDPIYLLGHFETPRRGVAEREQLQRELLRLWKQDPARMAQFDRDGDGQIGEADWEFARREATRLAAKTEERMASAPMLSRVMDTGDRRNPYLISTHPAQDLTVSLRWQVFGLTIAFLAIILGVGLALIERFGSI